MTPKTKMEKIMHSGYTNIGGMVVQKQGEIVYEKYFGDCTADSTLHVFSVTKSILSLLIGIAIDRGYIQSIEQNILDFFPNYSVKKGENTIQTIKLKDMLTMTAPYKYKNPSYKEYFTSDDWVRASLDLLGGRGKIGEFQYAPVIGPDIFSGILVQATGQTVLDFAREHVFSPLGITVASPIVFQTMEEQMAFYEGKNSSGWVADPNGVNTGGWGLTLTARDMAKIGQLYLQEGRWGEQQIVSSQWIKESTREHSRWGKLLYGYLWWIIDEKQHSYAAMGDGGNIIYVNEEKKMVISIASFFQPKAKDRIKLIRDYIEPAFE
ncbi:serine hydrolase domain-containing protein [Anaerosporobacter faecicola]|uniref:serine hydrolase domain-containing protein n=1 Tax=Anaerosporobacter faecicola TaxID=2718714 RepID=UPI001439BE6E|nr:serine hydrolase [Anaerosporobacter faecicola]